MVLKSEIYHIKEHCRTKMAMDKRQCEKPKGRTEKEGTVTFH